MESLLPFGLFLFGLVGYIWSRKRVWGWIMKWCVLPALGPAVQGATKPSGYPDQLEVEFAGQFWTLLYDSSAGPTTYRYDPNGGNATSARPMLTRTDGGTP